MIQLLKKFTVLFLLLSICPQTFVAQQTTPAISQNQASEIISNFDSTSYVKGRTQIKFDPSYSIHVDNRSTGRITVTGWDKDIIEATATSKRGDEMIVVRSYYEETQPVLYIKADYNPDGNVESNFNYKLIFDQNKIEEKARVFERRVSDNAEKIGEQVSKTVQGKDDVKDKKKHLNQKEGSVTASPTPTPPVSPTPVPQPKGKPSPEVTPPGPAINKPGESSGKPPVSSGKSSETDTGSGDGSGGGSGNVSGNGNGSGNGSGNGPISFGKSSEIDIEVKVPRHAELMPVKVVRSDVEIKNIDTAVKIFGGQSSISLANIESAEIKTKSGDVTVENATGLVDVTTSNGNIIVKNAKADVRVLSISGAIDVLCARGRVNINTTAGDITLSGASNDVDASNTYGSILFTGTIQKDGRYYLKSMSGRVEMKIQSDPPGFSADLSSYRNKAETGFALKSKQASSKNNSDNHTDSPEQRVSGSYGKGQALITLKSFDGEVILRKANANELKSCEAFGVR